MNRPDPDRWLHRLPAIVVTAWITLGAAALWWFA